MIPTSFEPLCLDDRHDYLAIQSQTPVRIADATFTNLWGWALYYGLEWKQAHGLCWLRQTRHGEAAERRLWAPVGNWHAVDWAAAQADLPELAPSTVFDRVPEALSDLWATALPGGVSLEETPGQWEYLYPTADLASLAGNRLHKKRNHVNAYIKSYGEDYRPLTAAQMPAMLDLQHDWCKWRECSKSLSLLAENEATERVLSQWETLGNLVGGGLYAEGELVAFSVGEALDERTMVVHFEKGRPEYRGVYQAMNCLFARNAGAGFELLNREQDTDEEGLRKAKQSYLPCGFLKKNRITLG